MITTILAIIVIAAIIILGIKEENEKNNKFKINKNDFKKIDEKHYFKPISNNINKIKHNEKSDKLTEFIEKEYNDYYKGKNRLYERNRTKNIYQKKDYKKALGDSYELQIGKDFQSAGYKVYYNGLNNGKLDKGIDIIAWSSYEVVLIQCKNHKEEIKQDVIRQFIGDCKIYEEKNQDKIKGRTIKRIFASNSNSDYGANQFLRENRNIIEFRQIPAKHRYFKK